MGQSELGWGAQVLLALCGTLPLLANLTVLSATTVSGTVVMGLGPSGPVHPRAASTLRLARAQARL